MIPYLQKLAQHSEIAWIAALALAMIQGYQWLDDKMFQRYRDRLADAADWSDEQRAYIDRLEEHIDKLESQVEELEDRSVEAERHAEWCERRLLEIADRLEHDPRIDWGLDDVS